MIKFINEDKHKWLVVPGKNNILLLGASCRLLAVAFEKVDINGNTPPFKIKADDECFKHLINILVEQFLKPVKFYNKGLYGAIEFIYKVSDCYSIRSQC